MATVTELRSRGSDLFLYQNGLYEPFYPIAGNLDHILGRFGDNYNVESGSHLYKLLVTLCGEGGAGALKKEGLIGRLQTMLEATHFLDLDKLYGNPLGLPRLSSEIYDIDPRNEIMDADQWQEVRFKDASYRGRCLKWMRALVAGPTKEGISLAAEAACDADCMIIEQYRYFEDQGSIDPLNVRNFGTTTSRNEVVIVPRIPDISEVERRRIIRLVDKLRPVNTIPTVVGSDHPRVETMINNVAATSERFDIVRYVTGRNDINWPPVDPGKGFWVVSGVEQKAPVFAFMERQETATYLSIQKVTASSEHVGPFNKEQRGLFGHQAVKHGYLYAKENSYAKAFALVTLSTPWMGSPATDVIIVNNHYPLSYFERVFGEQLPDLPEIFWASEEKLAPEGDELLFDLGRERPLNFIDFEISYKPVDFTIEYQDLNGAWHPIVPKEQMPTFGVDYIPTPQNPWYYFKCAFNQVKTQYIRISFTRREQRFPLDISDFFPWTIDIRNLRLIFIIADLQDSLEVVVADLLDEVPTTDNFEGRYVLLTASAGGFRNGELLKYQVDGTWQSVFYVSATYGLTTAAVDVPYIDSGTDILGNGYRTEVDVKEAENAIDGETDTFWQSQPNPTRHAVEALYLDIRTDIVNDIGSVIDEVYIDPITIGSSMHVYYSNDSDEPDWDNKLWSPVARNYILHKGFYALPHPTFAKYIKIEFCNLAATPYNPIQYPSLQPIKFKRFPSWIQDYFVKLQIDPGSRSFGSPFDHISIEPLELGFYRIKDRLDLTYERTRVEQLKDRSPEIREFIERLLSAQQKDSRTLVEDKIRFNSPVMWQENLLQQIDTESALARKTLAVREDLDDLGFNSEQQAPFFDAPTFQSIPDLLDSKIDKLTPVMWFPIKCRHGYQEIEGDRPDKLAYQVAIREVSFYRRDYSIEYDDRIYYETLDDDAHIEFNDFVQDEWRYVVGDPELGSGGSGGGGDEMLFYPDSEDAYPDLLVPGDG